MLRIENLGFEIKQEVVAWLRRPQSELPAAEIDRAFQSMNVPFIGELDANRFRPEERTAFLLAVTVNKVVSQILQIETDQASENVMRTIAAKMCKAVGMKMIYWGYLDIAVHFKRCESEASDSSSSEYRPEDRNANFQRLADARDAKNILPRISSKKMYELWQWIDKDIHTARGGIVASESPGEQITEEKKWYNTLVEIIEEETQPFGLSEIENSVKSLLPVRENCLDLEVGNSKHQSLIPKLEPGAPKRARNT